MPQIKAKTSGDIEVGSYVEVICQDTQLHAYTKHGFSEYPNGEVVKIEDDMCTVQIYTNDFKKLLELAKGLDPVPHWLFIQMMERVAELRV